ncbi:MAG: acetate--CoA ligase family protein [Defluviicoccus sp.]|nr:acetate--CoA ligase family protein [Defluviicoccus sp.]
MFRSVEQLFRPRSIAIVGASESGAGGWPRAIYANLEHAGFPVPVYLINPRRDRLWGREVHPSFASLPEPVDLALTLIPAESVADTLADGLANGLGSALVFAARFGEGGDAAGGERSRSLAELCARGLRVCGPNCMGALALPEANLFYPAERVRGLPKGGVGVVFQSGGTFQYWLGQGAVRGLGFSYAVSSGNELDLDAADYIAFLVDDPGTRVIACMLEGIRRPEAFMAAAEKALDAGKPIVAVKTGASERGRSATESHTGAVAGDDDIFNAVCDRYGILRCHGLDDLIETALMFSTARLPNGPRVAFAGYSGGATGLFLDYASETGLPVAELSAGTMASVAPLLDRGLAPGNPLDGGAGLAGRQDDFREICRAIADDPGVDILSMQGQLPAEDGERGDPDVFAAAARGAASVVAHGRMGQNVTDAGRAFQAAAGVPFLQGLPETVRALKALGRFAERRRRGLPARPATTPASGPVAELLAAAGVPAPQGGLAATAAEAASIAADIGYPVALKIVSPAALHKTEIGGVALGLGDAEAVARAADEMTARLEAARPGARLDGFLVQEMVDGLEFFLGLRDDPQFGPVIVAGIGGIHVEVLRDLAFRLLPIDEAEARDMLESLRARALLGAFRGREPRDVDALVGAMLAAGEVYFRVRVRLADFEINPLIVLAEGEGVRAVDIRETARR